MVQSTVKRQILTTEVRGNLLGGTAHHEVGRSSGRTSGEASDPRRGVAPLLQRGARRSR